ncbi:hypothetical protein RDABS01_038053 [Bienertia sinuspersici]
MLSGYLFTPIFKVKKLNISLFDNCMERGETLAAIMGAICSCLRVEDIEDYVNRNSSFYRNCVCLSCFLQNFFHMTALLLTCIALLQGPCLMMQILEYYRMQRDGLFSRREKGSSHSHDESEPLRRSDIDSDSDPLSPGDKWNESTCEDGSKEGRKSSVKLSSAKSTTVMGYFYSSSEDEDVCPTCLEEYTEENPKIVTKCSHHFHLGCIYEWMERSENCPVCGKVMAFDESP